MLRQKVQLISSGGTYFEDAKITKGKDGWYRCELTLGSGLNGSGLFVHLKRIRSTKLYW